MRQFIAPICLALQEDGHEVISACSKGIHWEELEEMGLTMQEIPIERSANPKRMLSSVWKISRWLRKVRPDVLHVHTPVASIIGRLAAFIARVPCVVYTAHGFYFHDRMAPWKRSIHFQLENFLSALTDQIVLVSQEDLKYSRRFWFIRRKQVHWIANGVDASHFDPNRFDAEFRRNLRSELGVPQDAVVVTMMGRLVREKGYLEFFKAACIIARRSKNVHFLAIGDTVASEHDDAKEEIMTAAEAPQLRDRVTFTGLRSDIPELLSITDIFCLPSYREGMPVSVIEAMMMAKPTVGTTIRGTRELIDEGESGFLVAPRDHHALANKLIRLIKDKDLRDKMGEAAFQSAIHNYTQKEQLDNFRKLFAKISKKMRR